MAPGGVPRPGPSKDSDDDENQPKRPTFHRATSSVEDVSGQAPALFKSFLAVCFEKDGHQVPTELDQGQVETNTKVAHALREMGDQLTKDATLNCLINECHVTKDTAFDTFLAVAIQIFQDGVVNWGRVVTLFYFGYKLAVKVINELPLIKMIIEWVVKFVKERLAKWICEQGGWESAMDYFKGLQSRQTLEFFFVLGTSIVVLVYLWNRR